MFILQDIIFNLFGLAAKEDDINKDVNNKGFSQRFNELLAGDLDDNELDLINNFVDKVIVGVNNIHQLNINANSLATDTYDFNYDTYSLPFPEKVLLPYNWPK